MSEKVYGCEKMQLLHAFFLVLIGIGAGFVQRVSGFGLGIFAMLFLPHVLPSHTAAAAISTLFSCVTSSLNTIKYRKHIRFRIALPMICTALVTIPIAVRFSTLVSAKGFGLLFGSVLILLALYFIFFNKSLKLKPTFGNGMAAGAVSGTLSGLFSTGGPPAVLYVSSATEDNMTYFAVIQFYFCLTNLYSTAVRALEGILTSEILLYAAVGIVGCMVGDAFGKGVFDRLDSRRLKQVIYTGMLLSGIIMLF